MNSFSSTFDNPSHQGNLTEEEQLAVKEFRKTICEYSWYDYERRLISYLPEVNAKPPLDERLNLAVKFLESHCTTLYGFLTDVSTDEKDFQNSVRAIPNVFDSAFIVDLLHTNGVHLSPLTLYAVEKLMLRSKTRARGLWNYFTSHKILPEDINTSCAAVLALIACGHYVAEGKQMTEVFLDNAVLFDDGLVDVYFEKMKIYGTIETKSDVFSSFNKWPVVCRVDLGTTVNFLYTLNKLQIPHTTKLAASYSLLDQVMDALLADNLDDPVITSYTKCFTNLDILLFFISRLAVEQYNTREWFVKKLAEVVARQLEVSCRNMDSISLSCRILSAINCNLHKRPSERQLILNECSALLETQDMEDFTFPKCAFYNRHGKYFFGSTAMGTAFAVVALTVARDKIENFIDN